MDKVNKMFFRIGFLCCANFLLVITMSGQRLAGDDRVKEIYNLIDKDSVEWVYGIGVGVDFRSLLLINPRVGTGKSQVGFGGIIGGLVKYQKGKWLWQNNGSLQLAAQKIGLGTEEPWIKNMDMLRASSKLSYDWGTDRWSTAADLTFQSILLPTYRQNLLRPKEEGDRLTASFFSPAFLNFSPGIGFKPDQHFTFLAAPFSFKGLFVLNQDIANLNIHGTLPEIGEQGDTLRFKRADLRFGFFLRTTYVNNTFMEGNLRWTTSLDLFSNYLRNPAVPDVLWKNDVAYKVWKEFFIHLNTELFYDQNVLLQVRRDGTLGKGVAFTSALYIKYNYLF